MLKSTAIVIDDEPDVRDVFSECLPLFDVEVLAKGNDGKEAVELYKKHRPEIVLMDIFGVIKEFMKKIFRYSNILQISSKQVQMIVRIVVN